MCLCAKKDPKHAKMGSYNFHWSFGNGKLAKEGIVSFNIPAFRSKDQFNTCPNAGTCALVCYARQGRYRMPSVEKTREHNIEWLRAHSATEFIALAVEDLMHLHPLWTRIRVHDSGDFFSKEYFLAWLAIARECKDKQFYAYTKMISMVAEHRHLIPENFHIIQSVGGLEDSLIDTQYAHSVIFPTHEALEEAGYIDGTESDKPAYTREIKIGLVYHGTTKLSENNGALLMKRALPVIGA